MISERIYDDTPPQMKILNMVIPILMHFCCFVCKPHNAARHPTKCDVINDVKLFPAVYRRIYYRKFLTLSNQKSRYKSKCIRIPIAFTHPYSLEIDMSATAHYWPKQTWVTAESRAKIWLLSVLRQWFCCC